jgi:hypothetical protein
MRSVWIPKHSILNKIRYNFRWAMKFLFIISFILICWRANILFGCNELLLGEVLNSSGRLPSKNPKNNKAMEFL